MKGNGSNGVEAGNGITVLRIQNPDAFLIPEIQDLFFRACEEFQFLDAADVLVWCGLHVLREEAEVFLARDGEGIWKGLLVIGEEGGIWVPDPWILHLYADEPGITDPLFEQATERLREKGVDCVTALNQRDTKDETMIRMGRKWADGYRVGGVIRYHLNGKSIEVRKE